MVFDLMSKDFALIVALSTYLTSVKTIYPPLQLRTHIFQVKS